MNTRLTLLLLSLTCSIMASAQIGFTPKTDLLTPNLHYSGVAIAIADMNGDGLDDIARLSQGTDLNIQYQTAPNQAFNTSAMTPLPGDDTWGMCTADVDNDGLGDVLSGGFYNGVKITRSLADGSFTIQNLASPTTFVQGVNFADINNDGWLDAFVCHDDGAARIFGNNGDGTFTYQANWINLATVPSSDNSGNYGSVWSDVDNDGDLDLYIAHCRQGVNNSADPRRINQLFLNNGDYTFTQDITNTSGLRIGAQSWTADFGDIDNDGDFDCFITNHDVNSQLLENDGAGHFTDITQSSGFVGAIQGLPLQGVFRDFDNDGFVDILVAGDYHYIFRNNGDKTFTAINNPFDGNQIESFAVGDLNHDGFQDVYAGYAHVYTDPSTTPDALWMNNGNNNHFVGLKLIGQESNRDGVGAKAWLYSSLGVQVREVRSGESYGISNSLLLHFGMGQVTQADSIVVDWPSGTKDVIYNPVVDNYLSLYEGGCLAPVVNVIALTPAVICEGETATLGTALDYASYLWSTGDTTATISVGVAGNYSVSVTNADGCDATSAPFNIVVNPVQIPTIEALGDTTFCAGGEVVLVCSDANAYAWSNGETTQSIAVSIGGTYTVAALGQCEFFESTPIQIKVLAVPAPVATPDTIQPGETALLVAQGSILTWYDSPDAQINLTVNDSLETPALTENTTYWVTNTVPYTTPNEFTGQVYHEGTLYGTNTYNGGLIFDCLEPFILAKVKVYTNKAGLRKIDLRTSNGDVIQSKQVDIPLDSSIVELNFDVPVANDMLLTTDETVNQSALGSAGPQLQRSSAGINFPYVIPGVLNLKTSTVDETRYYYFYDWEIEHYGYVCTSDRVPVTVVVQTNSAVNDLPVWASGLQVYPNPAIGLVNIDIEGFTGGEMNLNLNNAQGQLMIAEQHQAPAGKAHFQVDMRHLPAGIYWLQMAGEGGVVQHRIVRQ